LERLLVAPRDLSRWDGFATDPGPTRASEAHRRAYETYRPQFQAVAGEAERQWDAEIDWLRNNSPNQDEAVRERWTMIPGGPAARPFLVAFVRKMWLTVDAINRRVPPEQAVAPEVLLVKWLMQDVPLQDVTLKVLAVMPYWPLGLDLDGNWI
jgi:hypothetical protein